MNIYDIEHRYMEALEAFTDPEQEFDEELVRDTLESIEGEFEVKAIQLAAYIKQIEYEADAIKECRQKMERRQKRLENSVEWLTNYVKHGMELLDKKKIRCPWFVVSVATNPQSVKFINESVIPAKYKHTQSVITIDKLAIKSDIQHGIEVPGAELVQTTRLNIR